MGTGETFAYFHVSSCGCSSYPAPTLTLAAAASPPLLRMPRPADHGPDRHLPTPGATPTPTFLPSWKGTTGSSSACRMSREQEMCFTLWSKERTRPRPQRDGWGFLVPWACPWQRTGFRECFTMVVYNSDLLGFLLGN